MKNEEIDKKIGMPDINAEWAKFEHDVIESKSQSNLSFLKNSSMTRKVAAALIIALCLGGLVVASDLYEKTEPKKDVVIDTSVGTEQLVCLFKSDAPDDIMGYCINVYPGTWICHNDSNWLEEKNFRYMMWSKWGKAKRNLTMMFNGVPFDEKSIPNLSNKDLRKLEMTETKDNLTVNLITTDVIVPNSVKGNLPRDMTILLPGHGKIYITNHKAQEGNWMNCSCTNWEMTSYGWCVAKEFEQVKNVPHLRVYIYSSTETKQEDIDRATAMLDSVGIKNIIYRKDIPIKHFSDEELMQWAKKEKANGTKYADLYDKMAPQGMPTSDMRKQWHIVKKVYGVK